MIRMIKNGKFFVCCAFVVFGLAFWGCPQKEAEQEENTMPSIEAPEPEMGTTDEEQPMAPESEMGTTEEEQHMVPDEGEEQTGDDK